MNDYTIEVSKHAFMRIKERSGLNKRAAVRLAERAYENGIKHSETSGHIYKYISSLADASHKGAQIKLYGDKAFIFNKNNKPKDDGTRVIKLVTVIQMDNNMTKKVNNLKEKIRQ